MRKKTIIENQIVIESYGLSEEQHDSAVKILNDNVAKCNGYKIKDVDNEVAEVWIEDTEDADYKEFLENAIKKNGSIYTLCDELQDIGEVVVY